MTEFNDRKFCGRTIMDGTDPVTFRNIQIAKGGFCEGQKCGNFCVPSGQQCPLTEISFFESYQEMALSNFDKFVSLDDTNPKDVQAKHSILAFGYSEDATPITSIKIALSRPCFEPNFPSGLENDDNSIYQM